MKKPKNINLEIPRTWAYMTTQQMEVMADCLQRHSHDMQLNMAAIKTELLLAWNGIKVLHIKNPDAVPHEQVLLVTHPAITYPFDMKLWEIKSFVDDHMTWIDEPSNISFFPYPTLRRRLKMFEGPQVMMQNFTWRQYDLACTYMRLYVECQNELLAIDKLGNASKADIDKRKRMVQTYKANFLATIFNGKVRFLDLETGMRRTEHEFVSYQSVKNAKYFRHLSDTKFQCILFWWAGMNNYLKKQFPECFKEVKATKGKGKARQQDPLQQQAQLTATLQKETHQTEIELYRSNYVVVLRHLHNMLERNKEMEKMNQQK